MKRSILKLFAASALLWTVAVLTACSSKDDGPQPTYDDDFAQQLSRGETVACYLMSDFEEWDCQADGTYKKINLENVAGVEPLTSGEIIMQEGKILVSLRLMHSSGPDPIAMPLSAYQKATGKSFKVFVSSDIRLSADNKTLNIGGKESKVLELNSRVLKLETHGVYYDPLNDYKEADYYEIASYNSAPFTAVDLGRQLICTDRKDAYRKIIALCREQFGNTIDLNAVFAPEIQFDDPIIDLDALESHLLDS